MRCWIPLCLCAALVGCGGEKEEEEEKAPPRREEAREAAPQPAPRLEGPLTVEALLAAKRGVKPYDEWDAAWAHLTRAAGPPTRVDADLHGWYVLRGEECFVLEVVRDPAEQRVDSVLYGPFGREASEFARCAR